METNLNAQIPSNGLVALYLFNGNANDESGNNWGANPVGAQLTTDRCGNANSAYLFNGISDYLPLPSAFDFPERTVNLWFNTFTTVIGVIYECDNPMLNYGQTEFVTRLDTSTLKVFLTEGSAQNTKSTPINTNTWYMATLTVNQNESKYYLNGNPFRTVITDNGTSVNGADIAMVGTGRTGTLNFKGKIDDIAIYNRALSDSEILNLYHASCSLLTINGLTDICQGTQNVSFNVNSIQGASYDWTYTGTGASIHSTSNSATIDFADNATSGILKVTITGPNMLSQSKEETLTVSECNEKLPGNLNIPNSFSPNGDGINDLFIIRGLPERSSLLIFDRSGKKLYESSNYQNNWNGNDIDGSELESGTYWYVLIIPGIPTEFKGFVYLKR
jgi:gliding motility-associated-like protein